MRFPSSSVMLVFDVEASFLDDKPDRFVSEVEAIEL
jgi:hypothetical protein